MWSDILICFLGCGVAPFLSSRPALRSMRVASRSDVRVASWSQGKNFETKIFNFRCFLALTTKTSFTTPHYYPKYEVWAIDNFSLINLHFKKLLQAFIKKNIFKDAHCSSSQNIIIDILIEINIHTIIAQSPPA